MAARAVVRNANLREVAAQSLVMAGDQENLPETNVSYGRGQDGLVDIEVPAGEPGIYRLAIESVDALPMKMLVTYSDDTTELRELPVEIWASTNRWETGWKLKEGLRVKRVELDPDHGMPDVDRGNNVWGH